MANLHLQISHSPITLIIKAFISQLIQQFEPYWVCRTSPLWLLGLAVISSFIASLSGEGAVNLAGLRIDFLNPTRAFIEQHGLFSTFSTWASLVVFIGWFSS